MGQYKEYHEDMMWNKEAPQNEFQNPSAPHSSMLHMLKAANRLIYHSQVMDSIPSPQINVLSGKAEDGLMYTVQ